MAARSSFAPLLALGLAMGSPAAASESAPAILLVEIPIDAPGHDGAEETIRAALGAQQVVLLDAERTRKLREQAPDLGVSCRLIETNCAVELGRLVGGEELVTVQVERLAGAFWVRAARVSTATGGSTNRIAGRIAELSDDGEHPLASIVAGLWGTPPAAPVPVRVAVDRSDASILVDGAPAVRTDGIVWLMPGEHTVEARSGGASVSTTTTVRNDGDTPLVQLALKEALLQVPAPSPVAPTPRPKPALAATTSSSDAEPEPPPPSTHALPWGAWGAWVTGGGCAVALGGAALWLAMDNAIGEGLRKNDPIQYGPTQRQNDESVGRVGVALTILGVAAAGTGVVAWSLE